MVLWFGLKKLLKKERMKVVNSFKERDVVVEKIKDHVSNNHNEINSIKDKIVSRDEIMLLMENMILKSQFSQQSQSQEVSFIPTKSQKIKETIETKLVNRVRRNKKSLVMAEINKLPPMMSVIEMFDIIVSEKGLCSKASFYRYVNEMDNLAKSQSQIIPQEMEKSEISGN